MINAGDQEGLDHFIARTTFGLLDLEQRVQELSDRIDNIVDRLAHLTQRVEKMPRAPSPAAETPQVDPAPVVTRQLVSGPMTGVIRLVAEGKSEEAQRRLHELPEQELTRQPAVVALVAAALFVQRSDYSSAHKALTRARELTDDPRLLKVLELVEAQTQA